MRTFRELKQNLKQRPSGLTEITVFLTGDTSTQFMATAIKGEGFERGYYVNLLEAGYNQVERQVLDPNSDLFQFNAKYNVIFNSTHKLLEKYNRLPSSEWNNLAEERLLFIRKLCESVPGKIIYYNYPEIGDGVFGSYENKVTLSFLYQVRKLNFELMNLAQEYQNLFICDLSELQAKYGRDFFFDSNMYVSTDMILSIDALPLVASRTLDIICSIEGKINKCLILDLDNTLWGGIVGDDGWEGIQIGHGLGIGKVFTEFQQWIKKLKNRGIIICVCSKNDEDKAKEPFEKNPEMVLKLNDIAVFAANWDNKADNIRTIQKILNIGFDSMVFLDDNPFERNMVSEHIPGIIVPELPEDPGDFLEFMYSQNLFETASYSNSDKDRTRQYQVEAKRVSFAKAFTNEAEFLKSLNMVSNVTGFDLFNIPRIAQLSQRSNQFNLRTVRYTEEDIKRMSESDKYECFSFTLEDKFGDNGLIAAVILEKIDSETLFIDTWFMSCRVLKRGMENFTLNTILDYAQKNEFKRIVGEYIQTFKNSMVKDHYPNLGFTVILGTESSQFELITEKYSPRECFIEIK